MDILNSSNILEELRNIAIKYDLVIFSLFGSRASGLFKRNSDYDFAFIPPKNFTNEDEEFLFNDLMRLLENENIDLVNISKNYDVKLRYDIFHKGVVIYECRKSLFKELKHKSWIDYMDFKRFSNKRLESIKREMEKV